MTLTSGVRLGPYEITGLIGVGGMGEVYRATDTSLKRAVAVKVLPASLATDADRVARFQREAEVLASLNHPNIAQIHGLEKSRDTVALVMELVEGPTLADMLASGSGRLASGEPQRTSVALPISDALAISRQIADALDAAHERHIVHRDLKPANIKVRPDGTVKILDFGLAKAIESSSGSGNSSGPGAAFRPDTPDRHNLPVLTSPTMTSPALMTGAGMLLGTAAYMAPEQARGRTVDRRADIWAFGVVLYEMLAGRRPFDGDDVSMTLANVIKDNVQWDALPADVPASIRRLLRRCLEKDPKRRLAAISDARLEVDDAAADLSDTVATPHVARATARPRWLSIPAVIGSLIAAAAMSALGTWFLTRPVPTPARVERFVITTPPNAPPAVSGFLSIPAVAISPDGSRIIYRSLDPSSGTARLWVRDRGSLKVAAIPGTEGGAQVFWSPDGKWMAFFTTSDATLKRMPTLGGPAQVVCKVPGQPAGASWGADDHIVFATTTSKGLLRVPAAGGEPQVFTTVDATNGETHRWPEVLPDGKGVVFTAWGGSPDRSRIAVVSPSDGRISTLVGGGTYPRYARSGHLLFALAGTLRAVRLDPTRLAIIGDPAPVIGDLGITTVGAAHYAIGGDGTLVYASGSSPTLRTLVWVDRKGQEETIKAEPRAYTHVRLSPDGTRVALDVRDQEFDIWIWDFKRENLQRLTHDPGLDTQPVWTPSGKRLAFSSDRDKADGIFWQAADGSGEAERIDTGSRAQYPTSFSPDGKRLVFSTPQASPYDIGVLDLGDPRREQMLLESSYNENGGVVSPDGRWLAYQSSESGPDEIYVSPFPDVATSKRLVSSGGGTRPLWSKSGRELFYYLDPGTIMAAPVTLGSTFSFDKPVVAVKGPFARPMNAGPHYGVSPDGTRFLLLKDVEPSRTGQPAASELRIVLQFFDELDRLVGKGN